MTRFLILALSLCAAASFVFGQGNTGSILGTITDATGAVVPGAKVSVINTRTNVKVESTSDSVGNYLFNFLSPSSYRVEAEVTGFKKFTT